MTRAHPSQTPPLDLAARHTVHACSGRSQAVPAGRAAASAAGSLRTNTARAIASRMAVALWLAIPSATWAAPPYRLPTVQLEGGGQQIEAEIARDETTRQQGLMRRTVMPENHGMLFVFDKPAQYCFWMKDTLIPLSIAFLDDDGRVVDLADMQPRDERSHCPSRAVRLALEMNQGWFAAHHIQPGMQIQKVGEAIHHL